MINIDWSKAPDWADGHGLISRQGFTEVWINADQYSVVGSGFGPYPWGGGKGDTRHNTTRDQVQYITPRPGRWDGEGRPPVGVAIEIRHKQAQPDWATPGFYETTIVAIGEQLMILESDGSGHEKVGRISDYHFRPIRTPEQIAAEERQKAEDEMYGLTETSCNPEVVRAQRAVCAALYAAGYRKQEAP